jgi:hypothetical protein
MYHGKPIKRYRRDYDITISQYPYPESRAPILALPALCMDSVYERIDAWLYPNGRQSQGAFCPLCKNLDIDCTC